MKNKSFERGLDAARIERAFLDAFEDDVPPRGAKLAVMAAVGAGVSSAAAAGVASASAGARGAGIAKGTAVAALKWFGVGMLGGAAVLAPREIVSRRQAALERTFAPVAVSNPSERSSSSPRPARAADPDDHVEATAPPAPVLPKTMPLVDPRVATGGREDRVRSPGPTTAAPAEEAWAGADDSTRPPSRLAAETELLDGARQALAGGNTSMAIDRLDRYQIEFPSGVLQPEATVLRVEALVKTGDRRGAAALAQRSMATLPEKYAERIRRLVSF
jgi:hypothetical protein